MHGRRFRVAFSDEARASHLRSLPRRGRRPCRRHGAGRRDDRAAGPAPCSTSSRGGRRSSRSRARAWSRTGAPVTARSRRSPLDNVNGARTVFAVRARRVDSRCRAGWYRVQLPLRPNGVRGWIRARDVVVRPVTARIIVDLSARRVSLYQRGRRVLWTRAAIGTPATPTPLGSLLRQPAADPVQPVRPVRAGRDRLLGVLRGAHRLGAGRAGGDPRHEPPGAASACGCRTAASGCATTPCDDSSSDALPGTPVTRQALTSASWPPISPRTSSPASPI